MLEDFKQNYLFLFSTFLNNIQCIIARGFQAKLFVFVQYIFEQLEQAMEREGVKDVDLYDWEKTSTDLSTATTTTSTTAIQYHSTPEKIKSAGNTPSSHDKQEMKKHEHVLQQNKLNKFEGIELYFVSTLVLSVCLVFPVKCYSVHPSFHS